MAVCSGELFWETAEAGARRWVLVVHGPPGAARRRLDPQDPSTPQAATSSQLRESSGARSTRRAATGP